LSIDRDLGFPHRGPSCLPSQGGLQGARQRHPSGCRGLPSGLGDRRETAEALILRRRPSGVSFPLPSARYSRGIFHDGEAIDFVVGLVDPDAAKRESVRRLVPEGLTDASNSDVFEAVVTIASCFRPENVTKTITVGRPLRSDDFEGALRTCSKSMADDHRRRRRFRCRHGPASRERDNAHGMYVEIGPLAGMVNDRSLAGRRRASLVRRRPETDFEDFRHRPPRRRTVISAIASRERFQ